MTNPVTVNLFAEEGGNLFAEEGGEMMGFASFPG
jgi:hypothetical protein